MADNGSTDGSLADRRAMRARASCTFRCAGYGAALFCGIKAARGRFVIMGDSDDSYDFSNLAPFVDRLRAGDDLVMGNRFQGGIEPGAMPLLNRYIGNPVLSAIGRLFFRAPIGDFYCGLRGVRQGRRSTPRPADDGHGVRVGDGDQGDAARMRISEVPTTLRRDGRSRPPHLRPWRDGWRGLRFMLLYSPRWLFLYPGAVVMVIGLVVGTWLFIGPRRIGAAELDVHTLVYAGAATLMGYQAILFAVFSRLFASQHRLLPPSPQLERAFRYITLETGLLAGLALIAAGIALSVGEVLHWRSTGFGHLSVESTMRVVTLAVVSMTLGVQTVFASFFLSVLGLSVRQYPA